MRNFFQRRREPANVFDGPASSTLAPLGPGDADPPPVPRPGSRTPADDPRTFGKTPLHRPSASEAPPDVEPLPRFQLPLQGRQRPGFAAEVDIGRRLREAFTPTRPKHEVNSLFVGRLGTLRRIIAAIEEERAHVVLYGDRGRGKTSLSNAVERIAGQAGYTTLRLTCSAELSFEAMFRGLLKRIPAAYHRGVADTPFSQVRGFDSFDERLPSGAFSVTQLADVLGEIAGTHVLITLDEYDRIVSGEVKNKLAELIKNLTDMACPVTLFMIGVAENVEELLGKHPSIQRALVAVHLPPMTDSEIERIILVGSAAAGIDFDADVRSRIVRLSQGLPYYAQLLSLHGARAAIGRESRLVETRDLLEAVERCTREADRGLIEAYHRALGAESSPVVTDLLFRAAMAPVDEFGCFRGTDLLDGKAAVDHAGVLDPLVDGPEAVLERVIVPGGHRLRFRNQMMRQFILLMQAVDRGLV